MTIAIALVVIPFSPGYSGSTKRWWLTPNHQGCEGCGGEGEGRGEGG